MEQSPPAVADPANKGVAPVALARLVAEVTAPATLNTAGRYNRTYNRHNR